MSPAVTDDSRGPGEETPIAKRILIGEPLTSEELEGQLLPKKMALPIIVSSTLLTLIVLPALYRKFSKGLVVRDDG